MNTRSLAFEKTTCRLCASSNLWKAIPLSPLPVASPNVGQSSQVLDTAPADAWQCRDCGHLQLATVVDPEFQYKNFQYFSGISMGLRQHFDRLIARLADQKDIGPGKFVVDIGSNDGSLLRYAHDRGARVLGIDPAEKIAEAATAAGIPTLAKFFTVELGQSIAKEHGTADVVISNNTIANIDDLDALFAGISALISKDGILIIETQYALDMLTKTLLDVIYHEHISYFATKPTQQFLKARGFELIAAERIAPKGGSIRFTIQRAGGPRAVASSVSALIEEEEKAGFYDGRLFDAFNERIQALGRNVRQLLEKSRQKTGRGLVYGASVGCAALIHYFELGNLVDAVFDDTPLTNVIRSSAGDIPVLMGTQLPNEMPTDVVILAWRYASPIARGQDAFRAAGGRFYRALPDCAHVTGEDVTEPTA